jgi:hypothetical protein
MGTGNMPPGIYKPGLGSSGYASTSGSRLMRHLDPLRYRDPDIAQGAASAANEGVEELLAITRVGQVEGETSILKMEHQSQVFSEERGLDAQSSGIVGLPVDGSNPADVAQALLLAQGPVYDTHHVPSPEQVLAISSDRGGNVPPEILEALAGAERGRGILEGLPPMYDQDRFEVNNASGLAYRLENEEQGSVPAELIRLALEAETAQVLSAPKPNATVHPSVSNYEDSTGTKLLAQADGPGLAAGPFRGFGAVSRASTQRTTRLLAAHPEAADRIIGSGDGVNVAPDIAPGAAPAAVFTDAVSRNARQNMWQFGIAAGLAGLVGLYFLMKK